MSTPAPTPQPSTPDPSGSTPAPAPGTDAPTAARPSRRTVLGAAIPALAALAAVGAIGSPRPAQLGDPSGDAALARAISPHLDGHRHVAVALLEGDHTRFAGFDADEHREFEIGSVSKTFTAALLMDAIDRGHLALDSTVADVLGGEATGSAIARTTLQALATHSSGLPSLPRSIALTNLWTTPLRKNPYAGVSGADVIDDALGAELGDPGTFAYSNLGVALEGQLVARAQKTDWQSLLTERLLAPLGLQRTRAPRTLAELGADAPLGHVSDGHRCAAWVQDGIAPAGGIRSTASDLALYLRSMMTGANPGATGLEPLDAAGDGQQVAVNWFRQTLPHAGPMIWHNGMTGGFASFVGWVPSADRGVVLLTDTASSPDELAVSLLDGQVAS